MPPRSICFRVSARWCAIRWARRAAESRIWCSKSSATPAPRRGSSRASPGPACIPRSTASSSRHGARRVSMAERVANRRLRLASMWVVSFVLVGVYFALPGGDESVAIEAPSTNLEPQTESLKLEVVHVSPADVSPGASVIVTYVGGDDISPRVFAGKEELAVLARRPGSIVAKLPAGWARAPEDSLGARATTQQRVRYSRQSGELAQAVSQSDRRRGSFGFGTALRARCARRGGAPRRASSRAPSGAKSRGVALRNAGRGPRAVDDGGRGLCRGSSRRACSRWGLPRRRSSGLSSARPPRPCSSPASSILTAEGSWRSPSASFGWCSRPTAARPRSGDWCSGPVSLRMGSKLGVQGSSRSCPIPSSWRSPIGSTPTPSVGSRCARCSAPRWLPRSRALRRCWSFCWGLRRRRGTEICALRWRSSRARGWALRSARCSRSLPVRAAGASLSCTWSWAR